MLKCFGTSTPKYNVALLTWENIHQSELDAFGYYVWLVKGLSWWLDADGMIMIVDDDLVRVRHFRLKVH